MQLRCLPAAVLLFGLTAGAAFAAPPPAPTAASSSATSATMMSVQPTFEDADGKAIEEADFMQSVRDGRHYTMAPDFANKSVTMALLPAGASGGKTFADMQHATPSDGSPASTDNTATSSFSVTMDGERVQPSFQDADGNTISAATFQEALHSGQHFKMDKDTDADTVTLVLLPPGATGGASMGPNTLQSEPGDQLPDFELATVAGGQASNATLAGKPTLVDFFFATCRGCIVELPALNAWAAQHPEMNYLAVTFDDEDTARGFVKQRHFAWPVAYAGMPFIKELGVSAYPTLLLLDASGNIVATHTGSLPFTDDADPQDASTPDKQATKRGQLQWLEQWVDDKLGG